MIQLLASRRIIAATATAAQPSAASSSPSSSAAAAAAAVATMRKMSTAAAATVASSLSSTNSQMPSYITEAPVPTITKLDNGVTVASLFSNNASGASYTTTRLSNCGSRYDKVGGEAAILASSLGGSVGREHISLPSVSTSTSGISADELNALKASLIAKVANSSYTSQMIDHLHSTAFQTSPVGNSLGHFLEGTTESIEKIASGDVADALSNISGSNIVVVGTGCGHHDKLVEDVSAAYGKVAANSGGGSGKDVVKSTSEGGESSPFIGSDVRIRYDSHNTATVAIGFKSVSWTDPKAMSLALMTTILGSYTTSSGLGKNVASAMCQEVADHELASSIAAFNFSYSDTGLFGIVTTAPDNKLDDLFWYVMPNLVRLAHGISDEEFVRAKLAMKTQIFMMFDGDIASGEEVARQLQVLGRTLSMAEMVARVDALTMEDLKTAASEVVNDQDHALAAIGGIHELPDYNWIRRHSYMLRY